MQCNRYDIWENSEEKEMGKNGIIVEGFAFAEPEEGKKARKEAESIQYIKGNLDMENPRMVLEMYRKLTTEKVFETPVGLMYLKQLRDYLSRVPEIKNRGLEPIQVKNSVTGKAPAQKTGVSGQKQEKQQAPASEVEELTDWYEDQLEQEKQKRREAQLRQRRTEERLKSRKGFFRTSIAINVFLMLVVIGMVIITLMDSNPNILNYENRIVDRYAEWEQELEEREQNIKEREQELNL